jgi:hypothetical protein
MHKVKGYRYYSFCFSKKYNSLSQLLKILILKIPIEFVAACHNLAVDTDV